MGSRSSVAVLDSGLADPDLALAGGGGGAMNFAASAANSEELSLVTRGRRGTAAAFAGALATVSAGWGVGAGVVLPTAVRDGRAATGCGWDGGLVREEDLSGRLAMFEDEEEEMKSAIGVGRDRAEQDVHEARVRVRRPGRVGSRGRTVILLCLSPRFLSSSCWPGRLFTMRSAQYQSTA